MIRTPADEKAVAAGCYYDADAGDHIVEFFERYLKHSKGQWAGMPFELQPWQRDEVLRPLFGWMKPQGVRRFNLGYVEIPKKNGKSTLGGGIALYMLGADGEQRAEVYTAAADRGQASIVYDEAKAMVGASPALAARFELIPSRKTMLHPDSGSVFRALSADAFRLDGIDMHCGIFDELHTQTNRDLWDVLRYAGAARRQWLLLAITTAGYDKHSICYEQRRYAEQVRDGIIEDLSFFTYIRAADPEKDDWTKPETWRKANPSLGVTISEGDMAAACREAQNSPAKENAFKRLRLNIWTEQDVRWLRMDRWDACSGEVDVEDLRGRTCWGGLDLSSTTDITAAGLVFPLEDGTVAIVPKFWAPRETAEEKEKKDRVPYTLWARQGLITLTDGNAVHYERMRVEFVDWLAALGVNVKDVAFDPWNATHLAQELRDDDGLEMVEFRQGFPSMTAPTKHLEALVLDGQIRHGGHPILRWMASNVAVETDAAGNIKPSKRKSAEKIDGIVAIIMALGRAMVADSGGSVYDERGLEWV